MNFEVSLSPLTPDIIDLLTTNNLPIDDLTDQIIFFVLKRQSQLMGCGGLEQLGKYGLLRSICIHEAAKGKGMGKHIVKAIEQFAQAKSMDSLYLLTTTAAPFFQKLNYQVIDRQKVPEVLQMTSEFAHICPSSAICMKKTW